MRCLATMRRSLATWQTNRFSARSRSPGIRIRKPLSPSTRGRVRGGSMRRNFFAGQDRKMIPVLLGFLVLSVIAFAQDLPTGKPESLGLSSERLERIATAVQHDVD